MDQFQYIAIYNKSPNFVCYSKILQLRINTINKINVESNYLNY